MKAPSKLTPLPGTVTRAHIDDLVKRCNEMDLDLVDVQTAYDRTSVPAANKRQFLDALVLTMDVISKAAKLCKQSKANHHRWIKQDDAYRVAYESIKGTALDLVEAAFYKKIAEGDTQCILYGLRVLGKDRGLSDRVDPAHLQQNNIVVKVDLPQQFGSPTINVTSG